MKPGSVIYLRRCDEPPTVKVYKQPAEPCMGLDAERGVKMSERVFNLRQMSGPTQLICDRV